MKSQLNDLQFNNESRFNDDFLGLPILYDSYDNDSI